MNPADMIKDGDMEIICQKLDFLGINVYTGLVIKHDDVHGYKVCPHRNGYDQNALKWAWFQRFYIICLNSFMKDTSFQS